MYKEPISGFRSDPIMLSVRRKMNQRPSILVIRSVKLPDMAVLEEEIQIARLAFLSRLLVILLQFVANILIPDHAADAFNPPLVEQENFTALDKIIFICLGGFRRWDAVYFHHIALHGYTYENCVAFFPLYPLLLSSIRAVAPFLSALLSLPALLLLFAVVLNTVMFVGAAVILLYLGRYTLKDNQLAFCAAQLFCFNPASIFMSAPYSETVFALLTFGGMLCMSLHHLPVSAVLFGLSTLARSNGLVSLGFILHYIAVRYVARMTSLWNIYSQELWFLFKAVVKQTCLYIPLTASLVCVNFLPFLAYQYYIYQLFCFPEQHRDLVSHLPIDLVDYGQKHKFKLVGDDPPSSWCHAWVPLSYSYIQSEHWGVGLFSYYQFKQIPNFLLAAPMIIISVCACWSVYQMHPRLCCSLGLLDMCKVKTDYMKCLSDPILQIYNGDDNDNADFKEGKENHLYKKEIDMKNSKEKMTESQDQVISAGINRNKIDLEEKDVQIIDGQEVRNRNKKDELEDKGIKTEGYKNEQHKHKRLEFHAGWNSPELITYILHLLFLTTFGCLFMHIQVLTRLLCSASPVVYWFSAHLLTDQQEHYQSCTSFTVKHMTETDNSYLSSSLLANFKQFNMPSRLVLIYFLSYFVIGTVAFSNFLPWT